MPHRLLSELFVATLRMTRHPAMPKALFAYLEKRQSIQARKESGVTSAYCEARI